MDPIDVLIGNAWKRFAARFWTLAWIFALPAVLVIAGQLVTGRKPLGAAADITGGILSFLGAVLSIMATVALINAIAHGTDFAGSYRVGMRLFWPAVWIGILNTVAILGGAVLLLVPGIVMGVSLAFANYILVIENGRGIHVLRRSRFYVKDRWWAVFWRLFFILISFIIVAVFVYSPIKAAAGPAIGAVAYFVMLVCYTGFSTAYTFEIYGNLRRLKADALAAAAVSGTGVSDTGPAALEGDSFLKVCFVVGLIALAFLILLATHAI